MKYLYFVICLFLFIPISYADEITLHKFYSDTCQHCAAMNGWLEEVTLPDEVIIKSYNITPLAEGYQENLNLLGKLVDIFPYTTSTTPYIVIGTTALTGFGEDTKNQILNAISRYQKGEYVDLVSSVIADDIIEYEIHYPDDVRELPFLGLVDIKEVSIPLAAVVLGFMDGFNPCAMWVLLFIISMLFNMKNRKKMWIIGITFLLTSAFVYFLFLITAINVFNILGMSNLLMALIGIIALIGGGFNLHTYIQEMKEDDGCKVVDDKKRKGIVTKMRKIIGYVDNDLPIYKDKKFILALLGIMGLAFTVNLIELACSSLFPGIYAVILSANNVGFVDEIIYTLIYILFFLIDDLVVFIVAMKTSEIMGISSKFNKYSHLIGGLIMLIMGLCMIFKPEWIMLNF